MLLVVSFPLGLLVGLVGLRVHTPHALSPLPIDHTVLLFTRERERQIMRERSGGGSRRRMGGGGKRGKMRRSSGERQEEKSKWTTREMVDKEGGEEKVHRGEELVQYNKQTF